MADPDLVRIRRVTEMRLRAQEMRFTRTRRALDDAILLREGAECRSAAQEAMERALIEECDRGPANEQARIARDYRARRAHGARQETQARQDDEEQLKARRNEEAGALQRDNVRLGALNLRITRQGQALENRREVAMAEERQDRTGATAGEGHEPC